jgi:hypothetical protein
MKEAKPAQAEVDVIVTVTEPRAEEECAPKLTFGHNGAINDPELLRILRRDKPLGPVDVLKLAQFFSKVPTGIFLAETLRVSALAAILASPQIKRDVKVQSNIDVNELLDEFEDEEEALGVPNNSLPEEDPGDHGIHFMRIDLRPTDNQADAADSGLVIRSQIISKEKTLYYVVGVSPSPASLPLAGLKLHKSRKVYETHTTSK